MIKNKEQSILDEITQLRGRMIGTTTRIVDEYVQNLYKNQGNWITVHDGNNSSFAQDRNVLNRIIKRMEAEHPLDTIEVDKPNSRIRLTKCERDNVLMEIYKLTSEYIGTTPSL